jgi:hypothetical protein
MQPRYDLEEYANGATAVVSRLPGHKAKIVKCPVEGQELRVIAYPTGHTKDGETIPALFRRFGKRVRGYLLMQEDGPIFVPHPDYVKFIQPRGESA